MLSIGLVTAIPRGKASAKMSRKRPSGIVKQQIRDMLKQRACLAESFLKAQTHLLLPQREQKKLLPFHHLTTLGVLLYKSKELYLTLKGQITSAQSPAHVYADWILITMNQWMAYLCHVLHVDTQSISQGKANQPMPPETNQVFPLSKELCLFWTKRTIIAFLSRTNFYL